MTGGLFDPLGTDRDEPVRRAARPSAPAVAAGVLLLALAALLVVSWLRDSGDRGMPVAVGPIEHAAPPTAAPLAVPPAAPPAAIAEPAPAQPASAPPSAAPLPAVAPPGLPQPRDDQDVQVENGVRVVRPRRVSPASPTGPGPQTLRVPDGKPAR